MKYSFAAVLAIALLVFSPVASAQFGGKSGFSQAFKPDLLPRDMNMIVETLKLEDWQRPIVQSLLEDYQISFKTGTDAVREKMVNAAKKQKNGGANNGIRELLEPVEAWAPEKERLFEELMASIKGQLSDNQQERWPKFERAVLRTRSLDDSDLSGEGVDLIVVLRQMQLSPDVLAVAAQAMDQYELALDAALKTRDAKITALMPKFTDAMDSKDFETGANLQGQIMDLRVAVRQVQDDSIEKIAAVLPAPAAEDFRTRALSLGYREVFQPDSLANFFAAVLNLNDLTPEQKTGIQAAQTTWNSALASLQKRMLETTRTEEPKKAKRKMLVNAAKKAAKDGSPPPEVPPDSMIPLRNEKNQLVQQTRESVLKLLTPEQTERLTAGVPELRPPPPTSTPAMNEGAMKRSKPHGKPGEGTHTPPAPGSGAAPPAAPGAPDAPKDMETVG